MVNMKKIKLVIYNHDFNNQEFLTEVIRHALGYDYSQAGNCANVIINEGKYVVKTYDMKDKKRAELVLGIFTDQEIPAKLIKE
jgi:ATP-dependent Clp protease adapter protein ClpS